MREKIRFVCNPFSGRTRKGDIHQLIKKKLDHYRYDYSIVQTQEPGHAIDLAKKAVHENIDIVVAVGGDGSVNEVAQSLVYTNTALAILPAGSGNGLAKHLHLGRNIVDAIEVLNVGMRKRIDTCTVNDIFFINVAGIGLDATIAQKTKLNRRRGFLPYFITTLSECINPQVLQLEVLVDSKKIKGKYILATIANASTYGYFFQIAPPASINDGYMDIILFKNLPWWRMAPSLLRFYNNSIHKSKNTEYYRGKNIKIKNKNGQFIHVDGEGRSASTDLNFEIHPLSLEVIVGHKYS